MPRNKYSCTCDVSLSDKHGNYITAAKRYDMLHNLYFNICNISYIAYSSHSVICCPDFIWHNIKCWWQSVLDQKLMTCKENKECRTFLNTHFIADVSGFVPASAKIHADKQYHTQTLQANSWENGVSWSTQGSLPSQWEEMWTLTKLFVSMNKAKK